MTIHKPRLMRLRKPLRSSPRNQTMYRRKIIDGRISVLDQPQLLGDRRPLLGPEVVPVREALETPPIGPMARAGEIADGGEPADPIVEHVLQLMLQGRHAPLASGRREVRRRGRPPDGVAAGQDRRLSPPDRGDTI